jgi:hypothetical protein
MLPSEGRGATSDGVDEGDGFVVERGRVSLDGAFDVAGVLPALAGGAGAIARGAGVGETGVGRTGAGVGVGGAEGARIDGAGDGAAWARPTAGGVGEALPVAGAGPCGGVDPCDGAGPCEGEGGDGEGPCDAGEAGLITVAVGGGVATAVLGARAAFVGAMSFGGAIRKISRDSPANPTATATIPYSSRRATGGRSPAAFRG